MAETKRQLVDWLDDLCVRFIINLPKEELLQVERICFQVEEAQWYYEDFIRPLDPELPSLNLKTFCLRIFQHCPLLSQYSSHHHLTAFQEFLAYKTRVPVRGAILVNHDLDSVILVRGWKTGASWSFPRGKINKDERDIDCAIREVYEETGYHIREAGLVPADEDVKYIEMTMRDQHVRLYIFRDVPMDTRFEPRTRKEIGKIQWYKISELPTQKKGKNSQADGIAKDLANHANRFYMVAPFIYGLKKWISQQKKLSKRIEAPEQILDHESEGRFTSAAEQQKSDLSVATSLHDALPKVKHEASIHQLGHNLSSPDPSTSSQHTMRNSTSRPEISQASSREQRSQSLLALLQGKPVNQATELPQTPAEQIVQHPQMPPSPKYHHVKSRQPMQSREASAYSDTNKEGPRIDPKQNVHPPLSQIAMQTHINKGHGSQPVVSSLASAKPTFASLEQSTGFASAIPAASKLPPPKLTAQSSKLLDLFKSNKHTQAAIGAAPQAEAPRLVVESGRFKDSVNMADQASLEVSEVEEHHFDNNGQSNREPSEMSFEMPANVDPPELTPSRPQVGLKQSPRDKLAAWQKFQSSDAVRQAEEKRQAAESNAARAMEEARTGVKAEPAQPTFDETWKQVKVDDGDERRVVDVTKHKTESSLTPRLFTKDEKRARNQNTDEHVRNGTTVMDGHPTDTVETYRTALKVTNVETEEAVRGLFKKHERSQILFIQPYGNLKYLVHFKANEYALAAYHKHLKKYKPSSAHSQQLSDQPRMPHVEPYQIHRPENFYPYNPAEDVIGDEYIAGMTRAEAPDVPQATHGVSSLESKGLSTSKQPHGIPAVAAPSVDLRPARSDHQNTLLGLLKAPSVPKSGSTPAAKSTLEAPAPSFELSAIPSPGHSRGPSQLAGPLGVQPVGDLSHILPMSQPTTRRQKATFGPRKSPVSATVDGPLNVPQFDMLTQKHPSAKAESPKVEAARKSPITILARPSKSHIPSTAADQNGQPATNPAVTAIKPPVTTPTTSQRISISTAVPSAPQPITSPAPPIPSSLPSTQASTSMPPPTTTIRRPPHIRPQAHDSILSPISPLPSPKHSLGFDRRSQQTKEQKKSLLSLFNNNPNSSATIEIATASPTKNPPPLPPSRVDSTVSALISPPAVQMGFQERERVRGEAPSRSSSGRETPKDTKSFLLGYLDSVAMGGR
ncbi:MAG: hypothetical protein Q9195_008395 [Heterodermia aff. obscurata]